MINISGVIKSLIGLYLPYNVNFTIDKHSTY
jgi:hypothetical protein